MKVYGAYSHNQLFEVFFEKSEENIQKKSVYKWRDKREWFDNKSFF